VPSLLGRMFGGGGGNFGTAGRATAALPGIPALFPETASILGYSPEAAAQTTMGTVTSQGGGFMANLGKPFGGSLGTFGSSAGGAAAAGGMSIGGGMLMTDAFKRGGAMGALEGAGGGAMMGFSIGGPIGAAIGAGVGLVIGLLGGGEAGREKERQRRAGIQSEYTFDMPTSRSLTTAGGMSGDLDIETDLMGKSVARRRGTQTININVEAMDVHDFEKRTGLISKAISKAMLAGSTQLSDDIAYASR